MKNILLDFQFNHWQAVLLSALPALLNLLIFFYVRIKFPADKTSKIFSLFVLALVLWQTGDTFVRLSSTEEAALIWNYIFSISWIFVMPLGLHFCFLFTGRKKIAGSFSFQFCIYGPAVVFLILTLINKTDYDFMPSSFWGWVPEANESNLFKTEEDWISMQGIFMLCLLLYHAFSLTKANVKRKQLLVMMIGFSLPLLQGIVTEIILPHFYNHNSIPLASTSMTFLSVSILIALKKYNLFNVTDSLKSRTIIEAMTDILIILSSDKKIQFINREGEEAFGVSHLRKEELRIEDFFTQENSEKKNFSENLFAPVLAGNKIDNYSTELITKSGRKIPVLISATSYKTGLLESQVLLLIHDISDLIHTEEQLALREEQLKDKTDELNTFFYRTTHDMKGPLASITSLTKMIKNDPENSEMISYYTEHIESSALRLNTILLDFIKIMQVKERKTEVSLIDFPKMADSIIHSLKFSTGQDDVNFKVCIDSNILFYSDENLLDSILYNLVVNAVNYRKKYSGEKSFVHIQVFNFGNGIMMKVIDNGIGIKKEIQSKIFNLFFKGTENSQGTGLGLAILKNAIAKLNGRVELESEVDKGTTFTVYLPDLKSTVEMENTAIAFSSVS